MKVISSNYIHTAQHIADNNLHSDIKSIISTVPNKTSLYNDNNNTNINFDYKFPFSISNVVSFIIIDSKHGKYNLEFDCWEKEISFIKRMGIQVIDYHKLVNYNTNLIDASELSKLLLSLS